jgi:TRAP-type C4-dicarboxylate transport system permease large subunit
MVVNLLIGTLTPPFGVLLFVMADVAKVKLPALVQAVAPFYIPLFVGLMILTYWPDLSLFLPRLIFGQ